MRLRAHSSGVSTRRSTVAIAGVLALAILAALPRAPKRQEVARQHPPSPSAAEESGIFEPVGMLKSGDWLAPADIHKSRPQIPRGHLAAPEARDKHLTTPAIRHAPSSISEEAQIVPDSAVSPGSLSRSGVLTPHNLESKLGVEARVEEGQVSVPVVRSDPQVTMRTPLFTPPVLLFVESPRYPVEGYRIVVDHSASTPGVGIDAAEGRVRLKILVRADGSVGGVEVAQSSGRPFLDAAAMGEASRWRFAPATRDGQPIDAWALVPLLFVLR
jgi:TonB family protein